MFGEAWPSEAKKRKLRSQGIVPVSRVANRLIMIALLLYFLYAAKSKLLMSFSYQRLLSADSDELGSLFYHGCSVLFEHMTGLFFVSVVFLFTVTFLQSRFYFRPALLTLDLTRLWRWARLRVFSSFLKVITIFVIGVALVAVFVQLFFERYVRLLNRDSRTIIDSFLLALEAWNGIYVLLAVATLIAIGTARGFYFLRHRMSREELLAEQHER